MLRCGRALQVASLQRKVEAQDKKISSQCEQISGLKDQLQTLKAARQKAQDELNQQLQVRCIVVCSDLAQHRVIQQHRGVTQLKGGHYIACSLGEAPLGCRVSLCAQCLTVPCMLCYAVP